MPERSSSRFGPSAVRDDAEQAVASAKGDMDSAVELSGSPRCSPVLRRSSTSSLRQNTMHEEGKGFRWRLWITSAVVLAICVFVSKTVSDIRDSVILNWDERRTADEKLDIIWDRMTSNRESEPWIGLAELLVRGIYLQTDQTERLTARNNFRPYTNRKKFLHTQGAYVRVRWNAVPNSMGYTGLLSAENAGGIMSFSKGSRIVSNSSASWGMGLKLYRDNGPPAANVFCSPSTLLGQLTSYNWNMLDAPLCGHVDQFLGVFLLIFARKRPMTPEGERLWTRFGNGPGISNFADLTKTNETVAKPHYPFTVCMRAPIDLANRFEGHAPWMHPLELLHKVPPNTLLYEVYAFDSPAVLPDVWNVQTNAVKIAEVRTDSAFTSSRWGDNHMTYQHQLFEDDLQGRPDWKPQMTLTNLLMDGYGYLPLYTGRRSRFGTPQQIMQSYAPSVVGIFQILTNPMATQNLLADDIGVLNLQTVAQSALAAMYDSPNPNQIATRRLQEDQVEGQATPLVPRDIAKVLNALFFPTIPVTSPGGDSTNVADFENLGDTDFDPRKLIEAGEITEAQLESTKDFANNVLPYLQIDGHFIRPAGMDAFDGLLSDPVMQNVTRAVMNQYSALFGTEFLDDLASSIFSGPEGLEDIESLVRLVFAGASAPEDTLDNGETQSQARRKLKGSNSNQAALVKELKALAERVAVPMQKLGQIRPFEDAE